ncbi:MAG: tRNA(Met) cytidine acetyltransferase [Endozoicomonadaceae bacterium]|nr:tRNA(Met) cytidine acetyltransferase [Endozoicomonadaceae bacterium]
MAPKNHFSALVRALTEQAHQAQQRRTLVLSGVHEWCLEYADTAIATTNSNVNLWISNIFTDHHKVIHYRPRQTRKLLGTEADTVIIDAHTGLDPNALGLVSGIIRAGGLFIILCPLLHQWRHMKDPEYRAILSHGYSPKDIQGYFIDRIARILRESRDSILVQEGESLPSIPCAPSTVPSTKRESKPSLDDTPCRTVDQLNAVEAILRVATGHRRRPLVMTADRGRGKTSALGIAAAQILRLNIGSILVTAPRLDTVKSLFDQATRCLPDGEIREGCIQYENHTLRFIAPDALCLNDHDAVLVMVDEAAAIPVSLLGRLLKKYARIVFSSTIHGYEGSGRGFAIRFRKSLDRITPKWHQIHLDTPIRWTAGDPVEALVFELLLMDASPASDQLIMATTAEHDRVIKLSQQQLCSDERLLNALFGLLVTAHYQTTPRDLQRVMDSPDLSIYVLYRGSQVAGTVLTIKEGSIPQCMANAIWLGERRLQGHLVPQSLANHVGIIAATELSGERIMRIAIHPCLRRQGLGKQLLQAVQADCHQNSRDFIASSFGATPELINFWKQSDLQPIRLGSTRDTSSGEHSVLALLPLTDAGKTLYTLARHRFIEQLPLLLCDSLRDIEPSIVAALATTCTIDNLTINNGTIDMLVTAHDWQDGLSFAFGNRTYDSCVFAIEKLFISVLRTKLGQLSSEAVNILILKVLQKHSWKQVVKQCHFQGEKAAVLSLRQAVAMLLRLSLAECPASIHRTLQPMLDKL